MSQTCPKSFLVGLSIVLLIGCQDEIYRAETVIHPDGRIERSIYQPLRTTPETVRENPGWQQQRVAARIDADQWPGSIAAVPEAGGDDRPYWLAIGTFDSVRELPETIQLTRQADDFVSTLKAEYETFDLGLVTEHQWRETLTERVELDALHRSVEELGTLVFPLIEETLFTECGPDYDLTRLMKWLQSAGVSWVTEVAALTYEAGVRDELDQMESDSWRQRLDQIARRYGCQDAKEESLARFVAEQLRLLVRNGQDQPLSDDRIRSILEWINLKHPELSDAEEADDPDGKPLEEVFQELVEKRYGSRDAFGEKLQRALCPILGIHGPLSQPRSFIYDLTMPGQIIETSGILLSQNQVRFRFAGTQAYPLGHVMRCRSITRNQDQINSLSGSAECLVRQADQVEWCELMKNHDALLQAVQDSIRKRSRQPLLEAREALSSDNDADGIRSFNRALQLLDAQRQ